MFGALDIATSGMITQRTRVEVSTANLVNADTVTGTDGEYAPFRRRMAVIASGTADGRHPEGVHVREILLSDGPLIPKHDPSHRFADADGYVYYPDINPSTELINVIDAMRAYEASAMSAEATKAMMSIAMRLLA